MPWFGNILTSVEVVLNKQHQEMFMNRIALTCILAIVALVSGPSLASATTYWSTQAGGCVADSDSIQANQYEVNSNSIQYHSTATGSMLFYCSITNLGGGAPTKIGLSFDHTIATDANNYVTATLWAKTISSGSLVSIASVGGSGWPVGFNQIWTTFSYTFNTSTYYYLARVELRRNSSSNGMTFRGVSLEI